MNKSLSYNSIEDQFSNLTSILDITFRNNKK